MGGQVLTADDLIFPEASGNFSQTLLSLKRARLSIKNRIASILHDAEYVQHISQRYSLPLVANERCGSWYIPPENKAGSVYFKSTDGHQGQWKFSTRRLNLQILDLIGKHGGCIVADSTRRGKIMPDALSKTIPIWCAVMNRYLFPEEHDFHDVVVSPEAVAASEASSINDRLAGFVSDLEALGLDKAKLRETVKKPLRPYFVAPELILQNVTDSSAAAIICCSASRREHGDNDGYIQGAGDDNEHWSRGLTSNAFWQHRDAFQIDISDEAFAEVIDSVMQIGDKQVANEAAVMVYQVRPGLLISICATDALHFMISKEKNSDPKSKPYDLLVTCDVGASSESGHNIAANVLRLNCFTAKNGGRFLRDELPKLESALTTIASQPSCKILVSCESGKDLSVGVALAITCRLEQKLNSCQRMNKSHIRQRLASITTSQPSANPSRATLQSVNAYLMQERGTV